MFHGCIPYTRAFRQVKIAFRKNFLVANVNINFGSRQKIRHKSFILYE